MKSKAKLIREYKTSTFYCQELVNVMDTCISPGQSGGPVYGEDGKIVGMAIGHTMIYDQKGNEKLVSVYIPYKIIEKEWKKF